MDELLEAIRQGDAARVAAILDADPSLLDGPGLMQSLYRASAGAIPNQIKIRQESDEPVLS